MLSIGNKKYRNLQEQVGFNSEQIEKINEFLNGIVVEDKLIILGDPSGTLTNEELSKLSDPLSFIYYNGTLYIKASESLTEIVFKACDIVSEEIGNSYFNIGGTKIVITISSKSYIVSNDLLISTYSKTQLDALLLAKADLSGANFSGAITAPSIIENMSGYSFTKAADGNVSYEYIYAGAVKNGNKLTVVVAVNITKHAGANSQISLGSMNCPQTVMDKLYPTNVGIYPFLDNEKLAVFSEYNSAVDVLAYIEKGSFPDKLVIRLGETSNMVQDTKYFVRYEATFLLNDSLVS